MGKITLPEKYLEAELEAKRFLKRIEEFKKALLDKQTKNKGLPINSSHYSSTYWLMVGTKESGAVKRASLDLSRALSNLRKGN